MGFVQDVWKAFRDTAYEFQAGPKKPRRLKRFPKLPKVRLKREPEPRRPRMKPERKSPKEKKKIPASLVKIIKRERATINAPQELQEWEEKIEENDTGINQKIERAQERVERITSEPVKKLVRKNRRFYETTMSRKRKHLLFMNPGTEKINEAIIALRTNEELPKWAQPFLTQLTVQKDDLLFEGLPMATKERKRDVVKHMYFDPKGFSTIEPICDALREKFSNISQKNVRNILRSLETYQRNFGRRRPPKITGRMSLKNPGIIAMDVFFPTQKIAGWTGKYACLTCMDCWSRYTWVYALVQKDLPSQIQAMQDFLQKFSAFGWMPRRILADRGSDLKGAKRVIEPYRTAKDGNEQMVVYSQTAQPINIVEAMNSEVQRRMQVFRTSGLTDDPSILLDDISYSINNQKRPTRGNLSPLQLLSLNKDEIKQVNLLWDDRMDDIPEVQGLAKLFVGDSVRILMMTRKEQASNAIKGFTAKWSLEVYTSPIPRNKKNFRYWVGANRSFFRHELLKIPKVVDTETIDLLTRKQHVIAPDEDWSDLEYDSDDSRA